jgi:hypothetical protein
MGPAQESKRNKKKQTPVRPRPITVGRQTGDHASATTQQGVSQRRDSSPASQKSAQYRTQGEFCRRCFFHNHPSRNALLSLIQGLYTVISKNNLRVIDLNFKV